MERLWLVNGETTLPMQQRMFAFAWSKKEKEVDGHRKTMTWIIAKSTHTLANSKALEFL